MVTSVGVVQRPLESAQAQITSLDLNLSLLANLPNTNKCNPLKWYLKQMLDKEEKKSAKRRRSLWSASTAITGMPRTTQSAVSTWMSVATRTSKTGYGGAFTGLPRITGTPSPSKSSTISTSNGRRSAVKSPSASPGKKRKMMVFETKFVTPPPLLFSSLPAEEDEDKDGNGNKALLEAPSSLPQALVHIAQQPIVHGWLFAKAKMMKKKKKKKKKKQDWTMKMRMWRWMRKMR
ncbi:hypothetical protein H1R20_g12519, partial [Candolleomyces eurysporus]